MRGVVRKLVPALLGVALLGLAFLGTPIVDSNGGFDSDGRRYAAMADSQLFPEYRYEAPFRYRPLTPALARILPWETLDDFRVLAFVSDALSLGLLFLILRELQFSPPLCLLGMTLYGLDFWTLKFSAYSPAYIDHQTATFLLAIVYLSLTRRYLALLPLLALAATQKESLVVFSLYPAFALLRERRARGLWLAAALVAVPLATTGIVRRLAEVENSYDSVDVVLRELARWANPRFWVVFAHATLTGLGVLPLVLAARYREWLAFLRGNPEWLVYLALALALLLGGTDKSRLYGYALPLVVVLGLTAIRALRAEAEPRRFAAWLAAALLLHAFLGNWLTPMGSFDEYLARMVPEVAGRRATPYTIRNALLALAFLAATPWLLFGGWRFERAAGFVRAAAPRTSHSRAPV